MIIICGVKMNLKDKKIVNIWIKRFKIGIAIVAFLMFATFQNKIIYAKDINNYESTDISVLTDSPVALYNNEDDIIAYYYELSTGGYIIVNSDGSDFIEYSLEESEIDLIDNKYYYYNDVLSLHEKVDNQVAENCITGELTEIDDIDFNIKKSGSNNIKNATNLANNVISGLSEGVFEEKKLKYNTYAYNYNPDGRCGAVAGAILLRYYNDYVSTKYVKSAYETDDGKALINLLTNNYLGTGTTYNGLKNGLNSYLTDANIPYRFRTVQGKNSTNVFNKIREYIKNNKPVIVGLTGSERYGEHWVVGTGYSILYNKTLGFINIVNVNDGWGNRDVNINMSYVDGCQYIYK